MTAPEGGSSRRRVAGERLRGLLSLLVIVALLVGVPVALVAVRGNPLPAGIDLDVLTAALTSPDDGSLFLAALTFIAWAGWVSFAVSVLVEGAAQLRGLPTPRLPALGGPQRAASALVASALLLFTTPLLAAAPALAAPAPPASSTNPADDQAALPAARARTAASPTAPTPTTAPAASSTTHQHYTVQSGDSLWQIAADRLGDGARYTEIARLNYGAPQPDGRTLTTDHWLSPGWQLRLPPGTAAFPAGSVVVQPGDTLWQIAEDTLGDGQRYPQIAAASTGIQDDGGQLTDPDLIRPGWELTIPGDPSSTAASLVPGPPTTSPPALVPEPSTPPVKAHHGPASTDAPAAELAPADVAPVVPPVTSAPSPVPTASAPAASATATGAADQADKTDDQAEQDLAPAPIRTAAGVGSALAAGLLVLLGARRARQQRRRRPGQRIAMPPPELLSAELELRQVEDPDGLHRVDQALRTLSVLLGKTGDALPALRLARLSGQDLELYLAEPVALPAPFAPTGDPTLWTLPGDAPLLTRSELAAVPAPHPSLVTLGHDLDGAHLLLDLEHAAAMTVDGEPADATAVLAAIATELATSVWADDLQVTLVGCLSQLPTALGSDRVRHVPSLRELLPALEQHAADVRAALTADDLPDLRQARTGRGGQHHADAWTPEIVLLTGPVPPEDRRRLDAVVHQLPRLGVAAVTTAADPLSSEWALVLHRDRGSADLIAKLDPIGLTLRPQLLPQPDLDRLLALLSVADLPADLPTDQTSPQVPLVVDEPSLTKLGGRLQEPASLLASTGPTPAGAAVDQDPDLDPDVGTDLAAEVPIESAPAVYGGQAVEPTPLAPLVQVLGPVELLRPRGKVELSKRRQLTEIAAYLALHPGLDHDHLSEAIWPGARTLDNTRNTALSKLRKWLGTDPAGEHYVPRVLDDGYRLHPTVRSDWQLWQELLPHGPAAADTGALAAALELVKGKPFAGTNPRRYAWAERDRQVMISAIVDVAHELARRALNEADATLARQAAAAGLQADPGAELLWRDALRAEWLAGDKDGLTSTADRLSALADELGDDLEPETLELLEQLLDRPNYPVGAR